MGKIEKIPCTVEILTLNSEKTLRKCLESVKEFAEILVLDGNSSDRTLEIAREYNCRIYPQYNSKKKNIKIQNFSEVLNKGIRLASQDWIFQLAADEYLSEDLVREIRKITQRENPEFLIYSFPKKYVFKGKIIDCSVGYPNWSIRLWHKKTGIFYQRPVYEKLIFDQNQYKVREIKNYLFSIWPDWEENIEKWNHYIFLEKKNICKDITLFSYLKLVFLRTRETIHYLGRLFKVIFLSRGNKLPVRVELLRIWFRFKLVFAILPCLFKK